MLRPIIFLLCARVKAKRPPRSRRSNGASRLGFVAALLAHQDDHDDRERPRAGEHGHEQGRRMLGEGGNQAVARVEASD